MVSEIVDKGDMSKEVASRNPFFNQVNGLSVLDFLLKTGILYTTFREPRHIFCTHINSRPFRVCLKFVIH